MCDSMSIIRQARTARITHSGRKKQQNPSDLMHQIHIVEIVVFLFVTRAHHRGCRMPLRNPMSSRIVHGMCLFSFSTRYFNIQRVSDMCARLHLEHRRCGWRYNDIYTNIHSIIIIRISHVSVKRSLPGQHISVGLLVYEAKKMYIYLLLFSNTPFGHIRSFITIPTVPCRNFALHRHRTSESLFFDAQIEMHIYNALWLFWTAFTEKMPPNADAPRACNLAIRLLIGQRRHEIQKGWNTQPDWGWP